MKYKIKRIIDEWDPMNLFPGAPEDEHEMEIAEINKLEECLMIAKQILDK